MARTIHKHEIPHDFTPIMVREDAKLLSVQMQGEGINGKLCAWFECDPEAGLVSRWLIRVGTGHRLPDWSMEYVTTVQNGSYVWHVYEVRR